MSPRVWLRFKGKKSDETILKLRIQDLPEERFVDAAEFYGKYFLKAEVFCKASGFYKNPQAIAEFREFICGGLKDRALHMAICCEDLVDGAVGEILGCSTIAFKERDGEPFKGEEAQTVELKKLFELIGAFLELYDPMVQLQLSRYHEGRGIIVHPEYRKLGIGQQLVKSRRLICEAHGVRYTGAIMTSLGSQRAAEKENWETVLEVNFEELGRQHGVTFEDAPVVGKYMICRVDI